MVLKKDQIEEIKDKINDADDTQLILENIVTPLYINRMKRYSITMKKIHLVFSEAGFTNDQALEMTKIAFQQLLAGAPTSPSEILSNKKPQDYVR